MFFKAAMAMFAADAFDRRRREQQYRSWAAAEEARVRASGATTLFAAPTAPAAYDARWPERPT